MDSHEIMRDKDCVGAFNTKNPPSPHAMECLRRIKNFGSAGMPAQEINFTVRDKLLAFKFVTMSEALSRGWYKTHRRGQTVLFLFITKAGREALNT